MFRLLKLVGSTIGDSATRMKGLVPRRAGEELESFLLGSLLPVSGELTTGIPTFAPALSLKAGVAALALSLLCCGFGTSSAGSNGLASSLPSSVTFCYCREGG